MALGALSAAMTVSCDIEATPELGMKVMYHEAVNNEQCQLVKDSVRMIGGEVGEALMPASGQGVG
jgi:hypothetical protein